ncbi:NB-ARC domain-containing protein [Actinoplanes sp. NPDC051851]|uniref:NB-ARC domain-containing protein n=1 Tax=Actinoplanes sp. NPDC051851 TaxID=3154753 RepID=UPI00342393CD
MLEVLAAEAVRVMAPGVATVAGGSARRLWQLFRDRSERPPAEPEALRRFILRKARQDREFAAWLAQELVAVESVDAVAVVAPSLFVDREKVRQRLTAPGVWVVAGVHGSGKTLLSEQIAYDVRNDVASIATVDLDLFRDGAVLRLVEVQQEVLRQLGVPHVDDTAPIVADQYRRALRHRCFLLILDNVAGAAEAEALVHTGERAIVLLTTRLLSQDLRAWYAGEPVVLYGLDDAVAAERVVAGRCGAEMLAAEPEAVRELIARCDAIPSILAQAGGWLARSKGRPGAVAELVGRFRAAGDLGAILETSIGLAVDALDPAVAAGLRVLAGHPGADISDAGAGALLGRPADDVVDALLDAGLMARGPAGRLGLLWSVRRHLGFATEDAAVERYLGWFRDLAGAADLAMDPVTVIDRARDGRLRRYPAPPEIVWPFPGTRPVDWLQGEAHLVPDLLREAQRRGYHVEVVQICGAMEALLTLRGHHWLCLTVNELGIASAEALGWRAAVVRLHALQGRIYTLLGVVDRAAAAFGNAGELITGLEDGRLESSVLEFRAGLFLTTARLGSTGDLVEAESLLRRAVAIDRGLGLARPLGLHQRMLANVLIESGRPAEALALLSGIVAPAGDSRNASRVHLVSAKALIALGDGPGAGAELRRAEELTTASGATQYHLELADLHGHVARLTGDIEGARRWWGWVAMRYIGAGNPRRDHYIALLNSLPSGS